MRFKFHQEAITNFNQKSQKLVGLIKPLTRPVQRNMGYNFPSCIPSKTINLDDLDGDAFTMTECDYRGEPVTKSFSIKNRKYGLGRNAYAELKSLSVEIHMKNNCRKYVSRKFIEGVLCAWVEKRYCNSEYSQHFMEFLISQLEEKVVQGEYWVPIAFFEVERAFRFANSEVRPITEAKLNEWMKKTSEVSLNVNQERILSEVKKNYQGLAAVVTKIEGEAEFSLRKAISAAERVSSALAVFSGRTLIPDLKCVSRIKGSEFVSQARVFSVAQGNFLISDIVLDSMSMRYWRLSTKELNQMFLTGLGKLSELMERQNLSPFEESVLNTVSLYSKVAFTQDPIEKIVYALSAIESILLRNHNEAIQQNISERVAFTLSDRLASRKDIKARIKEAYVIRSKYVHHGYTDREFDKTKEFLQDSWLFILGLLDATTKFKSKDEFIAMLEDRKLS